jgi:hypothetical protein
LQRALTSGNESCSFFSFTVLWFQLKWLEEQSTSSWEYTLTEKKEGQEKNKYSEE